MANPVFAAQKTFHLGVEDLPCERARLAGDGDHPGSAEIAALDMFQEKAGDGPAADDSDAHDGYCATTSICLRLTLIPPCPRIRPERAPDEPARISTMGTQNLDLLRKRVVE